MSIQELLDDHKLFVVNMAIRSAMVYSEKDWSRVLRLLPHNLRYLDQDMFACNYISKVRFLAPYGKFQTDTMPKHLGSQVESLMLQYHFDVEIHAAATQFFKTNYDIVLERMNPSPIDGVNHRLGGFVENSPNIHGFLEITPEKHFSLGDVELNKFLQELKTKQY